MTCFTAGSGFSTRTHLFEIASGNLNGSRRLRARIRLRPNEVEGEGHVALAGEVVEVLEAALEVLEEGGAAFEDTEEVDRLAFVSGADVGGELLDPVHDHAVGDENCGDAVAVVGRNEEVLLGLLGGRLDDDGRESVFDGAAEEAGHVGLRRYLCHIKKRSPAPNGRNNMSLSE